MTTTYCIVDYPPTGEQYDAAVESESTVRKSLDGSKCVLKWRGETPGAFSGLTTFTHSEILPIMHSSEWSSPELHPIGGN